MVRKTTVGALAIGMLIGVILFALTEELFNGSGKHDVADDLGTLEDGIEYLEDLVAELNDTLAESHQQNRFVHSEVLEWVEYEEQIIAKIAGLPLLEKRNEPTREELNCYAILAAGQKRPAPSLDAVILGWEGELDTLEDDAQLSNIDLQNAIQKQQQMIQLLSGISKLLHDTTTTVIRKIG
jgi:hypothetical protein